MEAERLQDWTSEAKEGALDVQVVKSCPLIPQEWGLGLLSQYEKRVRQSRGIKS